MMTQPREDMAKTIAGENKWLNFSNKGFTQEETELLVRTLREAPHIIRFSLQNCWFRGDKSAVIEALKSRSDIEELELKALRDFEDAELMDLSSVLGHIPSVKKFSMRDTKLPPECFAICAEDLKTAPNLIFVDFAGTRMTDEAAVPFLEAVTANPSITGLDVSHTGLTDQSFPALTQFAHRRPQLLSLRAKLPRIGEESLRNMERELLHEPHPNLLFCEFGNTTNQEIGTFTRSNDRAMQEVRNRISKSVMVKMDQEDVWAATHLGPALDNVGPWVRKHYHTITEAYPSIGKDEAVTLDALFAADEKGFCPIDNPRTWSAHPDLLAKLGARGELTEETLARTTSRGHSLLQHALGFTPLASDVVGALNDYDIRLQHDQLFTEEGTPTPIMELFAQRRQVAALFSPENWVGETASKIRGTMDKAQATSPKEVFPNRHTLFASVGRLNRANGLEGMAR